MGPGLEKCILTLGTSSKDEHNASLRWRSTDRTSETGGSFSRRKQSVTEGIPLLRKEDVSEKRILIIDDDAVFRNTLCQLVESLGYLRAEAGSAQAALELMEGTHFSIVISDIVMPETDGLELLEAVKTRYPEVDVLIITGFETDYSALRIVQAGASDFLVKPFDVNQLGARLHKIERDRAVRETLYLRSVTDDLTGLPNRRYFLQALKHETERARRQRHPLSIVMVDVDEFKRYNDQRGHVEGDALLKSVATVLQGSVREYVDRVCRYGGDEFVLILPEIEEAKAIAVGNRIKKNFKRTSDMRVTLSVGVAELHTRLDCQSFIRLADKRMYQDKWKSKTSPTVARTILGQTSRSSIPESTHPKA
jgi:two-component system cell cycle response regulator